jgi:dTDP-glucose 4,6-dehydratase
VDDHATALWTILERGISGETYDIGGKCEKKNIDLLHELLEAIAPVINQSKQQLETLITFVPDRPAHDLRYAIRSDKIEQSLGWKSTRSFEEGLKETIAWYVGS